MSDNGTLKEDILKVHLENNEFVVDIQSKSLIKLIVALKMATLQVDDLIIQKKMESHPEPKIVPVTPSVGKDIISRLRNGK